MSPRAALTGGDGFDLTEPGTTKRLAVHLVRDPREVPGVARLGPDPLAEGFGPEEFAALLAGERRQIKGALRDQSLIAGIGNAYSDEILHAARMSPFEPTATLAPDETTAPYGGDADHPPRRRRPLPRPRRRQAQGREEDRPARPRPHRRTCPVCGDTVRGVGFAVSSLPYCPTCQTGGKVLADRRTSRLLK